MENRRHLILFAIHRRPASAASAASSASFDSTQPAAGSTQPFAGSTQPIAGATQPVAGSTLPIAGATQPVASLARSAASKCANKSYCWFWQDGEKWLPFNHEISGEIEREFAVNPRAKFSCNIKGICYTIDLGARQQTSTQTGKRRAIKRLPDASSITGTERGHSRTCVWEWEKTDDVWVEFDGSLGGITSDDVEGAFKNDPQAALEFHVNETAYVIDLKQKAQINQLTNTGRRIRRRILKTAKVNIYPSYWTDITEELRLVPIADGGSTTHEFRKVTTLFLRAMPNFKIHSIERVQNRRLYETFHACKKQVAERLGKDKGIQYLFHGTKNSSINAVCQWGFNSQPDDMCMYGKGSYFARNVKSYSMLYANCNAAFLAKVLVGEYTVGDSSMVRSPPIPHSDVLVYDSCVDNVSDPQIFVTFDSVHSYPSYVITYDWPRSASAYGGGRK